MRAFSDFRALLTEKLPRLSAELSRHGEIPALLRLRVKPVIGENGKLLLPETRIGSLADKRKYWMQTGALGILTGYIEQPDDTPYVHTTFYWGKLSGPYPDEMITLELPGFGKSFDSTNDSHSVATLYALAQEIKHDCNNVADTVYLLSEAQKRASAVAGEFPELGAELKKMIVTAINTLRSNCK